MCFQSFCNLAQHTVVKNTAATCWRAVELLIYMCWTKRIMWMQDMSVYPTQTCPKHLWHLLRQHSQLRCSTRPPKIQRIDDMAHAGAPQSSYSTAWAPLSDDVLSWPGLLQGRQQGVDTSITTVLLVASSERTSIKILGHCNPVPTSCSLRDLTLLETGAKYASQNDAWKLEFTWNFNSHIM